MIYKILRNGFLAAFRIAATVSCFLVCERGKRKSSEIDESQLEGKNQHMHTFFVFAPAL